MKLKYKKTIIIITMSTMGIGLVTLSMGKPKSMISTPAEVASVIETVDYEDSKEVASVASTDIAANVPTDTTTNKTSTTEKSLGKEEDNDNLKRDEYKEINDLITNYLDASVKCDIEALSKLVSDSDTIDVEELQRESEYIEGYKNVECYTKNGPKEGTYIVYVYQELKLVGVESLAPGMTRLYVSSTNGEKPYIISGEIDEETKNYIDNVSKDKEVVELFASVNAKFDAAVASDTVLREFLLKIEQGIKDAEEVINNDKTVKE